jgi:polysaccharide pyruvyl transferase CsaB
MKKNKNILLCGWYGSRNAGDDAILEGILYGFSNYVPQAKLTVLSNKPYETKKTYGIESIYLWKRFKGFFRFLRALAKCDLFLVGGGSLIQDVSSFGNIIHWLLKITLAKIFGKKVALIAIGADYLQYRTSKILAKAVLNRVQFISTRDVIAADIFKSIGINQTPIYALTDTANLIKPAPYVSAEKIFEQEGINFGSKTRIAINIRQFYRQRKFLNMNKRKWSQYGKLSYNRLVLEMANIVTALQDEFEAKILFVPFQVSESDDDNLAIRDVIANIPRKENIYMLKHLYPPSRLMAVLGTMEVVISMRLHPLILAANMGVPVFGVPYAPKTNGFLKEIDMEEYSCPINNLSTQEVLPKIKNILGKRSSVIDIIKHNMEQVRHKAIEHFYLIEKTL